MHDLKNAQRSNPDKLLSTIADYVLDYNAGSEEAYSTARYCLLDSLGCAMLALQYPACRNLLGPLTESAELPNGVRVPGTHFRLDPVQAAFNIGTMIRWLDYNDTWLAAEWGHPSDNLGGILAAAEYLSISKYKNVSVRDVLSAMIKAYEIQGVLALNNSFNRVGLDHVILVRIATTAVVTWMLGGTKQQIENALSNAWIDGGALRTYRHAPNTGSRKSWAAGDASARGVWHAFIALKDEMGYPSALSANHWGFQDILFKGNEISLQQPLGCYVMENVLFKVSYPAEFHAQTAVEAALQLHGQVKNKLDEIAMIDIETQESAVRIIDKTGPLNNPADRDHCLQYMVAIPLIYGELTAKYYEDHIAANPAIDNLRTKMRITENIQFSKDYLNPGKRAIPNAITITMKDGSQLNRVQVDYPLGHRLRRSEAVPDILKKFIRNCDSIQNNTKNQIVQLFSDIKALSSLTAVELINFFYTD